RRRGGRGGRRTRGQGTRADAAACGSRAGLRTRPARARRHRSLGAARLRSARPVVATQAPLSQLNLRGLSSFSIATCGRSHVERAFLKRVVRRRVEREAIVIGNVVVTAPRAREAAVESLAAP